MAHYRITGGTPLRGEVAISGRKNAALKLIAAAVLSDKPVTISNLPGIRDVDAMLAILEHLGATIDRQGSRVTIQAETITSHEIPTELGKKLRASVVLVGPLLARFGEAVFPHPGGDLIGKRSITPHLLGFQRLGATVEVEGATYRVSGSALKGAAIYLKESSVTGTENLIMAAVRAEGTTVLYNAAQEPHIVTLCELLRGMGFLIQGDGTSTVTVTGQPNIVCQEAQATVIPDDIEVGTFAVAALATQGDVTLTGVGGFTLVMPILSLLEDFNATFEYDGQAQTLHLMPSPDLQGALIRPQPWPSFPSDLGSVFAVLATQATGTSLIHEWMYEGRLAFLDSLKRMGADILISDPHRAVITGPTKLSYNSLISTDIRAGAALIIASLIAKGTSKVEHIEHVERGYDRLDQRLQALGAKITREED